MHRPSNRLRRFLSAGPIPPSSFALSDFYREEFIKHHKCLQRQREYFSASVISDVECALMRIIAQVDTLSASANADEVMARLLREFDVVTGLSTWSDSYKVH
ncbi:MAG: hypothetical protein Q8L86_18830 [Vicinamibacterales bacterium]|nr:hypothetical protein [Vicinamibacterales bacterium]